VTLDPAGSKYEDIAHTHTQHTEEIAFGSIASPDFSAS
jgi:hypothetical protein